MKARNIPLRLVTGAYILHTGIEKWNGSAEQASGVHGMASAAYPLLKSLPPDRFLRLLAAGEMATGSLLLAPFVSTTAAGAALTSFSGALLGMYARTPWMRKPNSIWPEQAGIPVSKDAWMFGIGLSLILNRERPSKHLDS